MTLLEELIKQREAARARKDRDAFNKACVEIAKQPLAEGKIVEEFGDDIRVHNALSLELTLKLLEGDPFIKEEDIYPRVGGVSYLSEDKPRFSILLTTKENEPICQISAVNAKEKYCQLFGLYTAEKHREKKFATRLVNYVMALAKKRAWNCPIFLVDIKSGDKISEDFWTKFGFNKITIEEAVDIAKFTGQSERERARIASGNLIYMTKAA